MKPYYSDKSCTIYLGDCREILPTLDRADLLLADPPYGIGFAVTNNRGGNAGLFWGPAGALRVHEPEWIPIHGDNQAFDPAPFLNFKSVILWGANNYSSRLPDSRGWIVWDKLGDKTPSDFGDVELAWSNLNSVLRIHRQLWRGIVREGIENVANGPKLHPCQKPVELMRFCIVHADTSRKVAHKTILDPFMGSGTTLRAAKDLGRKSIGIEVEERYCEIAVQRLRQEVFEFSEVT